MEGTERSYRNQNVKDCTERHGSKRLINVVKEKQCKAIYVVLITRFIQYCRYMFAVSRLLLACHFHSCSVTLLSSQKHFSFFFHFSFSCNSVVSVSAVFCVLLQNFSVNWWASFKMQCI